MALKSAVELSEHRLEIDKLLKEWKVHDLIDIYNNLNMSFLPILQFCGTLCKDNNYIWKA